MRPTALVAALALVAAAPSPPALVLVDAVDGAQPPPQGSALKQQRRRDVRIKGWAADSGGMPLHRLRSLTILVDGRPVCDAAYGAPRDDVRRAVALDDRHVGFSARFATDELALGTHTIAFSAVLHDGRRIVAGPAITLDVVPSIEAGR